MSEQPDSLTPYPMADAFTEDADGNIVPVRNILMRRRLREHGCDPGEFWGIQDDDRGPRFLEEIPARRPSLLMLLRWLLRR